MINKDLLKSSIKKYITYWYSYFDTYYDSYYFTSWITGNYTDYTTSFLTSTTFDTTFFCSFLCCCNECSTPPGCSGSCSVVSTDQPECVASSAGWLCSCGGDCTVSTGYDFYTNDLYQVYTEYYTDRQTFDSIWYQTDIYTNRLTG